MDLTYLTSFFFTPRVNFQGISPEIYGFINFIMFYMDLSGTVSPVWVPEIAIDGWTCSVASGWSISTSRRDVAGMM